MLKVLLLLVVLIVAYGIYQVRRNRPRDAIHTQPPETIVVCAHCRLHIPQNEAIASGDVFYCCEAHRERDLA